MSLPRFARRHVFTAAISLSIAAAATLFAGVASAATLVVPDQYPTIQPAIDAAVSGDSVLIRAGTYVDSLILVGKDITLLGEGAATTILTTNDSGRILDVGPGVTSATRISRLQFTNSRAPAGGAIRVTQSSPVIVDCRFFGNDAYLPGGNSDGGAIFATDGSTLLIEDCDFTNNAALIKFDGFNAAGGAISAANSSLTIRRTRFDTNYSQGFEGGAGGAVALRFSPAVFESCSFIGNLSGGGLLAAFGASLVVRDCVFRGNQSGYGSTCINWSDYDSNPIDVRGCVFFDNWSPVNGYAIEALGDEGTITRNTIAFNQHSGIRAYGNVHLDVQNNIIARNQGVGIAGCNQVAVTCNDLWGNTGGDADTDCETQADAYDNFSADPLFCDSTARDLSIRADSPCSPDGLCEQVGALGVGCEITAVSPPLSRPGVFSLAPVHPNPSAAPIHFDFELAHPTTLSLEIYEVTGRRVVLVTRERFEPGRHAREWSGLDRDGRSVPPGIYLAVLRGEGTRVARRFALTR